MYTRRKDIVKYSGDNIKNEQKQNIKTGKVEKKQGAFFRNRYHLLSEEACTHKKGTYKYLYTLRYIK